MRSRDLGHKFIEIVSAYVQTSYKLIRNLNDVQKVSIILGYDQSKDCFRWGARERHVPLG